MNDRETDHHLRAFAIAAYALGGIFFLFQKIDLLWSGSIDAAQHVAFVTQLMDHYAARLDFPITEMLEYPRYAHAIAAAFGLILNSAMLGVQITVLLSLLLGWTALLVPGWTLSPRVAALHAIFLPAIFLLNAAFLHLEVFGQETIGNFFFAQLVAQALAFVVLAVYIELEIQHAPPWLCYLFVGCAVQAVAQFHLVPSVELLGFLGIMMALDLVTCHSSRRMTQALQAAVIGALSAGILFRSTVFRMMVAISENNGTLNFRFLHDMASVLAFAVVTAGAFSAVLFTGLIASRDKDGTAPYPRAIAAFGLGASVLCVLQFLALKFGSGSEYAVKKYLFTIYTMLLVLLSIGAARALDSVLRRSNSESWLVKAARYAAICGCPLMLLLAPTFGTEYLYAKTSRIAEVERFARAYSATVLGDPTPKHDAAIDVSGLHPVGDYLISLADLHMPRDENAFAILDGQPPPHPKDLRYLITSARPSFWSTPKCRRFTGFGDLVVVEMSCLLSQPTQCADWNFAAPDAISPYAAKGISHREPDGRWNDGTAASIVCVLPPGKRKVTVLRITTQAFVIRRTQHMLVDIDGQRVASVLYDKEHAAQDIAIPIPSTALTQQKLRIDFHFPDAISPYDLGLSGDRRKLAVKFRQFSFE